MTIQEEKCYIGIDVSKHLLDVFISLVKQSLQFVNDKKGIQLLIEKLKSFSQSSIVMEATGGYEKLVAQSLTKSGLRVSVVNPRQIRDFAKAMGKLAKTDKIDSKIIAQFGEKIPIEASVEVDESQQKLAENNARRRQLLDMIIMEKNRLDKANPELKKSAR